MKNRIETALETFRSVISMRFARWWAQTRRRLVWKLKNPYSPLGQVRVHLFS